MLIESLKMKNFRQFKGETNVFFSCDPKKNVTVILGNNTFGKTTLLQAFNWCFYNEVNLPHKDKLLNYEVMQSMPTNTDVEVSVEIGIKHGELSYTIKRSRLYMKLGSGEVRETIKGVKMWYKQPDGQTQEIPVNQISDKIDAILPKDLSSYFFFDTERVQDIGEKTDLSHAVKGLLGLSALDNAKKHLGAKDKKTSVIGQFYSDLAKYSDDKKVEQAMEIISDHADKITKLETEIENAEEQIRSYEEEVRKLNIILADAESTKEHQRERNRLEQTLKDQEKRLEEKKIQLRKRLNRDFGKLFLTPLIASSLSLLKDAQIEDKGIKGLTAATLKELLHRGVCVCGRTLEENTESYNHVLEEINYVPPASIGTLVMNYKTELEGHTRGAEDVLPAIRDCAKDIYDTEIYMDELKPRIDELGNKIAQQKDLSTQEEARNRAQRRIKELREKKEGYIAKQSRLKQNSDLNQQYVDTHAGDTKKSKELNLLIAYASEALRWINEAYDESEKDIKEKLLQSVNDIFDKIYTGSRKVEIDKEYHVKLLTKSENGWIESGESEGLKRVKNFSFIAGLVTLAKERVTAKTGLTAISLSSEPYPLVMDAPFSNADEYHTANISRVLPQVAEQVIMFVMQKDWNYAEKVMGTRVGVKCQLNKINDLYTQLEVVEHV